MQIGLIGLNYRLSSAAHRELFIHHLQSIAKEKIGLSSVLLSTCNRIELYFSSGDVFREKRDLIRFLTEVMPPQVISELYAFVQFDCFYHLTKVTSGIDSALFGESEIQSQVKKSYEQSRNERGLSKEIHFLFQKALMIGKMIRGMGIEQLHKNALEQTIVHFILREYREKDVHCLLMGNSHINRKLRPFLEKEKFVVTLCSRTKGEGNFIYRDELQSLSPYQVVVCATKDEEPVIGKSLAHTIETSCLLFDLGMPRNIDPSVGTFQRASLFDLEQLQNFMKTEYQVPQMVQEGYLRAAYSIAKRYHERFAEREQISLLRAQELV